MSTMKYTFKQLHKSDLQRYKGKVGFSMRCFLWSLRKCQTCRNPLTKPFYRLIFSVLKSKWHIELSEKVIIGPGLYLGHPFCMTINPKTIIGSNCNIHKGVTFGQENRGSRKGAPTIGNKVWIGINATIVGNVVIGDDVLIAPNSYVNCNVPSHSIVFGNPCIIKHKENATDGYINHLAV